MELAIGIRECDEVEPGRFESGPKRRAVAEIPRMTKQSNAWPGRRQFADNKRGLIRTAVVNDQDFEVVTKRRELRICLANRIADPFSLVECGNYERDLRRTGHLSGSFQTASSVRANMPRGDNQVKPDRLTKL
jgi:hypothetical protein